MKTSAFPLSLRIAFGMVAIFIAGTVTGGFLGARVQMKSQHKRAAIQNLEKNVMLMLEERLSLSSEQSEKLQPLVEKACDELRVVQQESAAKVEEIMDRYYDSFVPELDAEQARILRDMETELHEKANKLKPTHAPK